MIAGGGYEGPGPGPDRAAAMVWGVSELMREPAGGGYPSPEGHSPFD